MLLVKEMEHTMKRWTVTALVAGLFVAGVATLQPTAADDAAAYEALNLIHLDESIPLPDVSLPDLKGDPVPLLSFRNRVVILNFWTTWCHYCERERAALEALYQIYKEDGLAVLAVNMGETVEQVRVTLTTLKSTASVFRTSWTRKRGPSRRSASRPRRRIF